MGLGDDIRIEKTQRALFCAMTQLLTRRSFKKISVLTLCEEAQVGRATFYAHFDDKYKFLEKWLSACNPDSARRAVLNCSTEGFLNDNEEKCRKIIGNIIAAADYETQMIVSDFLLSLFDLPAQPRPETEESAEAFVFSNFFASGILGLLMWQVNNFLSTDTAPFHKSLGRIIEQFRKWDEERITPA